MKGKRTNSLKPPLTKSPSEIGYWELNEVPRSGGCLRQKPYMLPKVSYKFLNFWGKTIWGNYGKQAKSKRERVYHIDEITNAKGGGTLNAYMCVQGGMWKNRKSIEKSVKISARTKWIAPNKCYGIFFVLWSGQVL